MVDLSDIRDFLKVFGQYRRMAPSPRFRKIASFFIAIHLFVIASAPNALSYLNNKLDGFLLPYINTLGLNQVWQFFSPDPGPPLHFRYKTEKAHLPAEEQLFPPPAQDSKLIRNNYNRRVALVRVVAMIPTFPDDVMGPYLCRLYPDTDANTVEVMAYQVPNSVEVANGKKIHDLSRPQVLSTHYTQCPKLEPLR